MPFGVVSAVGLGMGVLDGLEIVEGEGQFWGHPIATDGDFVA